MKYSLLAIVAAGLVAGCAHVGTPHVVKPVPHIAKPVAKPVVPVTPNAIVKKRWYQHFPHHPKWFHH